MCTSIVLAFAILFSTVAPAARAAEGHAPTYQTTEAGNCAAPDRATSGGSIFLLLIKNATTNILHIASFEAAPVTETAPVQLARTLNYEVCKFYTYLYDYAITTQSMSRDKEAMRSEAPSVTRVNSYVDVTILSKAADGAVDAQLVMREPFLCGTVDEGQQIVAQDQTFIDQLTTPLRFNQAANGVITEVMSLPALSSDVPNMQKGVINYLQMTLRADSNA